MAYLLVSLFAGRVRPLSVKVLYDTLNCTVNIDGIIESAY